MFIMKFAAIYSLVFAAHNLSLLPVVGQKISISNNKKTAMVGVDDSSLQAVS